MTVSCSWARLICLLLDVYCLQTFTDKRCFLKDESSTGMQDGEVVKQTKRKFKQIIYILKVKKKQLRYFGFTYMFSLANFNISENINTFHKNIAWKGNMGRWKCWEQQQNIILKEFQVGIWDCYCWVVLTRC